MMMKMKMIDRVFARYRSSRDDEGGMRMATREQRVLSRRVRRARWRRRWRTRVGCRGEERASAGFLELENASTDRLTHRARFRETSQEG